MTSHKPDQNGVSEQAAEDAATHQTRAPNSERQHSHNCQRLRDRRFNRRLRLAIDAIEKLGFGVLIMLATWWHLYDQLDDVWLPKNALWPLGMLAFAASLAVGYVLSMRFERDAE